MAASTPFTPPPPSRIHATNPQIGQFGVPLPAIPSERALQLHFQRKREREQQLGLDPETNAPPSKRPAVAQGSLACPAPNGVLLSPPPPLRSQKLRVSYQPPAERDVPHAADPGPVSKDSTDDPRESSMDSVSVAVDPTTAATGSPSPPRPAAAVSVLPKSTGPRQGYESPLPTSEPTTIESVPGSLRLAVLRRPTTPLGGTDPDVPSPASAPPPAPVPVAAPVPTSLVSENTADPLTTPTAASRQIMAALSARNSVMRATAAGLPPPPSPPTLAPTIATASTAPVAPDRAPSAAPTVPPTSPESKTPPTDPFGPIAFFRPRSTSPPHPTQEVAPELVASPSPTALLEALASSVRSPVSALPYAPLFVPEPSPQPPATSSAPEGLPESPQDKGEPVPAVEEPPSPLSILLTFAEDELTNAPPPETNQHQAVPPPPWAPPRRPVGRPKKGSGPTIVGPQPQTSASSTSATKPSLSTFEKHTYAAMLREKIALAKSAPKPGQSAQFPIDVEGTRAHKPAPIPAAQVHQRFFVPPGELLMRRDGGPLHFAVDGATEELPTDQLIQLVGLHQSLNLTADEYLKGYEVASSHSVAIGEFLDRLVQNPGNAHRVHRILSGPPIPAAPIFVPQRPPPINQLRFPGVRQHAHQGQSPMAGYPPPMHQQYPSPGQRYRPM